MIAWNRRHGEDINKLMKRPDYVAQTISRARKSANKFFADKYTQEIDNVKGTEYEEILKESTKKKSFEIMSYHLGFKILDFINYKQEKKNKYVMETSEGEIIFIGTDEIHMKSKFEQRILASTNIAVTLSRKDFETVKSTYKPILRNIIVSRESSIETRMKEWINEYLDGKGD